ncbi:polyprenyl synthetase family protein [SAR86 cluster bacterium]|nr:polyprenyl synthetase family protein [SAR86 cluster bacterium]
MELLYKKVIFDELEKLEITLSESINSDIELATEVSGYIVNSGGKRIRPAICILVAKTLGYSESDLIQLASSIELLHTATLIHDDVVDESLVRRGKESIQAKWDNAHGVLVGDFVYSKAFQLMASFDNPKIIRELANATNKISEGEVLQLSMKRQSNLSEEDYFNIIDRKTAELFKVSAVTAGILCKCAKPELDSLNNFATSLGLAFQIQDDILDYYGQENLTGKKVGKDYEEGKFTLPIILSLKTMNQTNKTKLLSLFETRKIEDFAVILSLMETEKTLEQLQTIFTHYSNECINELEKLPRNQYRDALEDIVINLNSRLT